MEYLLLEFTGEEMPWVTFTLFFGGIFIQFTNNKLGKCLLTNAAVTGWQREFLRKTRERQREREREKERERERENKR